MRVISVLIPLSIATPAYADPPVAVGASVSVVSDYRFRGISLSDRRGVMQASIEFASDAGFTASIWTSSIADNGGSLTEVDLYGGYAASTREIYWTIGTYSYLYPGGRGVNYLELRATAQKALGPVTVGTLVAYTPRQRNVIGMDNLYLQANLGAPIGQTPFSVRTSVGYENGFYDRKLDVEAALQLEQDWGTASISYIATNAARAEQVGANGRPTLVAGVLFQF